MASMSHEQPEPTSIAAKDPGDSTSACTLTEVVARARTGSLHGTVAGYLDRLALVARVAESLAEAHDRGMCHGQLHPGLISISPNGAVLISGWGVAGELKPETAPYQSPERVRGDPASVASDIYALGAILWELLTLRPPLLVEKNLVRFWRRKKSGDIDPLPSEVRCHVPAELLQAARTALDPDPAARWPDIPALLAALRTWRCQVESVAVTLQAERTLAESPADAQEAAQGFRAAMQLWPENPAACAGLAAAGTVRAIDALHDGNAQADALMPTPNPVLAAVAMQVDRLRHRQRQDRRLRIAAYLGLALLTVVVVGGTAWLVRSRDDVWRPVAEWRPVAGVPLTGLCATAADVNQQIPLAIPDADTYRLPSNQIVWLNGVDGRGDVRVTVDMVWPERVDGLEMMLGVQRTNPPAFWMTPPGYICQFGGFDGAQTFISASAETARPQRPPSIHAPFTPGKPYSLCFEKRGARLRLIVDGKVIYQQQNPVPIGDNRSHWIAIRAWCDARISRILVEKPALPTVSGPLTIANVLAESGFYQDAFAIYVGLSPRGSRGVISDEALARSHFMASRLTGCAPDRQELFGRAMAQLVDHPLRYAVLQTEATALWKERDWSGSLALARQAHEEFPQERCALALLELHLPDIPEPILAQLLALVRQGPATSFLDLSGAGLHSLQPLQGMPLYALDISGNAIEDLTPLAGMRLHHLRMTGNRISDLKPLQGMPLAKLFADGNRIVDLTPLAGAPVRMLSLAGNRITSLAGLARIPVFNLDLSGNPLTDITPLASLASLRDLRLSSTPVRDLRPLAIPTLRSLWIDHCPVEDLSPLAGTSLDTLHAESSQVADVTALPRATMLRLHLADCPISDLASLAQLKLCELDLSRTRIDRLDGLGHVTFLGGSSLRFGSTVVSDLRPLSGLQPVALLDLGGTKAADLSPLIGTSIDHLVLTGTPVTDLRHILNIPNLRTLDIWKTAATSETISRLALELEGKQQASPLPACLRVQAAYLAKDWQLLRNMAKPIGQRMRLALHVALPLAEARAWATAASARLAAPLDREDLHALRSSAQAGSFWVDLLIDGEQLRWADGRSTQDILYWLRPTTEPVIGYKASHLNGSDALLTPSSSTEDRSSVILEW